MNIDRYMVVGKKRGQKPTARLTVSMPSLSAQEIAIKVTLDVPDALFTRPQLEAKILIPDDAVSPNIISAEVVDNIEDIISKELGVDMSVSVVSAQ